MLFMMDERFLGAQEIQEKEISHVSTDETGVDGVVSILTFPTHPAPSFRVYIIVLSCFIAINVII